MGGFRIGEEICKTFVGKNESGTQPDLWMAPGWAQLRVEMADF